MAMTFRMAFAGIWLLLVALALASKDAGTTCDRACLEGLMSDYLNALISRDFWSLKTTPEVKYVENGQIIPFGTGEWFVAGSLGKYRHVFSDTEAGQVAAITTMKENGIPIIYVVRLKLDDDGSISEIEAQVTRDSAGAALYENMTQPEAVWLEAVPADQRIPRDELITQVNKYYSGMQRNDPNGDYSFFDKDCNRLEDGLQTTNMGTGDPYGHSNDTTFESLGCEAQFQTGFLGFVTKIRDRRFPVVDEERQAVLAITILDHNGTVRTLPGANGTSSPIPPYFDIPRTLEASEAFRLRGDKLYRIEMTLTESPYGMRCAWPVPPLPQMRRRETNAEMSIADPCGRACLNDMLDQVLQALVAHDPSKLPLADDARYSENGQFLSFGDGMWETLAHLALPGVDDYVARFSDPDSGTAAYWGLSQEFTTPGVLALRVKVERGKITEMEAIDVRAETITATRNTVTLMRPPLPVEWAGADLGKLDPVFQQDVSADGNDNSDYGAGFLALVKAYFDGQELHSSLRVSFAPECTRRDNGVQQNISCAAQTDGHGVAPNGLYNITTVIRDRHILALDVRKGVVMAVGMVDNPAVAPGPLPATQRVPSSYMVPQLIKIDQKAILRVEGMVKWMPYGYVSAWGEDVFS